MNSKRIVLSLSLASLCACTGSRRQDHTSAVEELSIGGDELALYFPLDAGFRRDYEGLVDGQLWQEVAVVLQRQQAILGVLCTGVQETVIVDGHVREVTTEWFAPDSAGAVWKYGEESIEISAQGAVIGLDSWFADTGDNRAWPIFPARVRAGVRYFGDHGDSETEFAVRSTSAVAETPAGTFDRCLDIEENPDDPADRDIILFAPGMGKVSEESQGGTIQLVRQSRPR